jgi:hypothetical protein
MATATRRRVPEFLIIGAQKAGTTSLHTYLCAHPQIAPPTAKEVHYFDLRYRLGGAWYRAHFPVRDPSQLSGESSPYYLYHPLVPSRVAQDLSDCKFIVLLRNPVDRAISHYHHAVAYGREPLPLREALEAEPARLAGEEEKILADPRYRSDAHQNYSYVARGRYIEQVKRWLGHLGRDRFLFLSAEELFVDPGRIIAESQAFLGLDTIPPEDLKPRNARSYMRVADETRDWLAATFSADNRALYELLGRDFGWD